MRVTDDHVRGFLDDGLTLIDEVFTEVEMARASAGLDAMYAAAGQANGIRGHPDHPDLAAVMCHPHLERIARTMLQTDEVVLNSAATLFRLPDGVTEVRLEGQHVDIMFSLAEMAAKPRRMLAMMMVMIDDLPAGRGNTWIRPGSHRLIAQWLEDQSRPPIKASPTHWGDLPQDLPYADLQPVIARRGQTAAFTTAVVHCGSTNVTDQPRRIMFVNFSPRGLLEATSGNHDHRPQREAWRDRLRDLFPGDRRHLLLTDDD